MSFKTLNDVRTIYDCCSGTVDCGVAFTDLCEFVKKLDDKYDKEKELMSAFKTVADTIRTISKGAIK